MYTIIAHYITAFWCDGCSKKDHSLNTLLACINPESCGVHWLICYKLHTVLLGEHRTLWGEREQAMPVSWQVDALPMYYKIARFVTLHSLSQGFLHMRVQRTCHLNAVNSLPCVKKYHTVEPFEPLLSLGFGVHTLTGKDWLLIFCEHTAWFVMHRPYQ